MVLNDILNQMDFVDIYRMLYPKTAEYTFFSSTNRTFSRIDYMLGHKTNLNKLKKIKILPSIFSNHSGMKLEMSYKKKKLEKKNKHMEPKQCAAE